MTIKRRASVSFALRAHCRLNWSLAIQAWCHDCSHVNWKTLFMLGHVLFLLLGTELQSCKCTQLIGDILASILLFFTSSASRYSAPYVQDSEKRGTQSDIWFSEIGIENPQSYIWAGHDWLSKHMFIRSLPLTAELNDLPYLPDHFSRIKSRYFLIMPWRWLFLSDIAASEHSQLLKSEPSWSACYAKVMCLLRSLKSLKHIGTVEPWRKFYTQN